MWASVSAGKRGATGQEGKPPAEEKKVPGPDKMKERGFDNFLQRPATTKKKKKYRSIPEDTQPHICYI